MIEFSKRIEGLSEYYFSTKLREVKSLIDSGEDIINLGIGSPDLSPPSPVIEKLKDSLNVAGAHKYQSYIGVEKFRKEISNFYKLHYNCNLNYQWLKSELIKNKYEVIYKKIDETDFKKNYCEKLLKEVKRLKISEKS